MKHIQFKSLFMIYVFLLMYLSILNKILAGPRPYETYLICFLEILKTTFSNEIFTHKHQFHYFYKTNPLQFHK